MASDLSISVKDLRASAGAADDLVTDLKPVLKKAVDELSTAAASLRGWDAAPRMGQTSDGWGRALGTVCDRLCAHASGMRILANGRDIMEEEVRSSFAGW
ncbi:hypothetical protein [Streptomyces paludis]|uniref:Uncharacterized protein n=1 Tax=Streptomyces paludis TaxID=2282738 RepID=A0A345HSK4_9ACTN|nr:hypothetical protein [Streptomyces paludis]AXG79678.1 hypothetical protein DVK44_20780 [Streptomyces paludis]